MRYDLGERRRWDSWVLTQRYNQKFLEQKVKNGKKKTIFSEKKVFVTKI